MVKIELKLTSIILFVICLLSCNNKEGVKTKESYESIHLPTWLIGEWEQQEDEDAYIEHWEQSENELIGAGFFTDMINGKSDVEHIKIQNRENSLHYSISENNEQIFFPIEVIDSLSFICLNPRPNQFPSSIKYTSLNKDNIIIEVAGYLEEELDSYAFNMKRKK